MASPGAEIEPEIRLTQTNGLVLVQLPDRNPGAATTGMVLVAGSRVITEKGASAEVQWGDGTVTKLQERSQLEIAPSSRNEGGWIARLFRGTLLLISGGLGRDPGFETPHAFGGTRGTEYQLSTDTDRTVIRVRQGEAIISSTNAVGATSVMSGLAAVARPGERPQLFALVAPNTVEWWLSFPAVLCVDELPLTESEKSQADAALVAWREGDFRTAFEQLPIKMDGGSSALELFRASVLLAAGDQSGAETALSKVGESSILTGLRNLIAAVTLQPAPPASAQASATELLGRSYLLQSERNLHDALRAARSAVARQPDFALASLRVAELEFSFANLEPAADAVQAALRSSPRNVQAHVLHGFILLAKNRLRDAAMEFRAARTLDPQSADAWLGSGLIQFREGKRAEGLFALEKAAALHPNRSMLRAYLGRARSEAGVDEASEDFRAAAHLDPGDPTPSLYSALELYAENRPNEAIAELERSVQLNRNRAVYRSDLLLDEDAAARSASLARVYQRAGLPEVALREAARAVAFDYGNPSAHLFLADSFNALRDPSRFNLRYETAWFNEVLLANALAPVDAGVLSPSLAHQEYTRMFARDGLRLTTFSELRSDEQFRQLATQSGVYGRSAYSVELDYEDKRGVRPNNDLSRMELYTQIKQQFTDRDTAMLLLKFQDYKAGDNFSYVDPADAQPDYRYKEDEDPIAYSVLRHDWAPGVQTLFAVGRLALEQQFAFTPSIPIIFYQPGDPKANAITSDRFPLQYRNEIVTWNGELQQIFQSEQQTFVGGLRIQNGEVQAADRLTTDAESAVDFGDNTGSGVAHSGDFTTSFRRISLYSYETFRIAEPLALTAGAGWEHLDLPSNFRHPPLTEEMQEMTRLLPKAALVWSPTERVTLRGMYSRALGGVTFDESYRLEPVQLGGFSQAYRTLIPESLAGSVSGHRLQLAGAALDVKLPTRTYLGLQGTLSDSDVSREIGAFSFDSSFARQPPAAATNVQEKLRYREFSVSAAGHQLLGDYLGLGLVYTFTRATLDDDLSALGSFSSEKADLHSVRASATVNFPTGWFGNIVANALWQNDGIALAQAEHFLPIDLEFGWRFPRQHGEVSFGIMNMLDDDYRLAPLSGLPDYPRERTFFTRMRINL